MSKIIIFTMFEKKSLLFFISSIFSAEMFTKFSFPEMKSNLPWGLFKLFFCFRKDILFKRWQLTTSNKRFQ